MRMLCVLGVALTMVGSAIAAPNVTNTTQKGSLLIWPDVRIDDGWNTLVRLQNDGTQDVPVKCYWMDGNKNRVDFAVTVTRNQALWFDARTGRGTFQVNRFLQGNANGLDNPFLAGPWPAGFVDPATTNEGNDTNGPYLEGLLACWAVDPGLQNQVKWNHLSGTATVHHPQLGAYEYNAYAFYVPVGLDQEPIGIPGTISLDGVSYDACPQYQIGQFTPLGAPAPGQPAVAPAFRGLRLAVASCTLTLQQDYFPVYTKLEFEVWNEDEVKFTGAYECADSWHETEFESVLDATNGGAIDASSQNFDFGTLGTYTARYRIQGRKSTQCPLSQATAVIGIQSMLFAVGNTPTVGTALAAAGKLSGKITWDVEGIVPEGGIR